MSHSLITNRLSKCFGKAGILENKPEAYRRVSCSRMRFSIITELVALREDSLDSIAHCYGKHGIEVRKKHYVQFFSNREAAELSWKSYESCRSLTKDEETLVNKPLELLEKRSLPTAQQIEKWYKELKSFHKVHSNVNVTVVQQPIDMDVQEQSDATSSVHFENRKMGTSNLHLLIAQAFYSCTIFHLFANAFRCKVAISKYSSFL